MLRWFLVLLFVAPRALFAAPDAGQPPGLEKATFAGGCFWCIEADFDPVEGVVSTVSGYIGGQTKDPTYKEVSAGGTGHAEVVQIGFDPRKVSYEELLKVFWRNVDPTRDDGQFCDDGRQYRTGIFVHGDAQREAAEKSRAETNRTKSFPQPIVTQIEAATTFYPAEDYHQNYYKKNPLRYKYYRYTCGRDKRLKELWGAAESG